MTGFSGFILASASPRRRALLHSLGAAFTAECADTEELAGGGADPRRLPELNALRKASAVAARHPGALVLGADTVIVFRGEVIGKPADETQAAEFLRAFSGETHEVVTGMALVSPAAGIEEVWHETSQVTFRPLDEETIRRYLAAVPVLDKAGAYALQEHGEMIVEKFTGERENIVGLPLVRLRKFLEDFSLLPLDKSAPRG